MFIAIDGDDVGSSIERCIILCEPEELTRYCRQVSEAMNILESSLLDRGAIILMCSGDSILANLPGWQDHGDLDLVTGDLPIRFSIGTGRTMQEAYLALKTAKASGKRCWVDYADLSGVRTLPWEKK